MSSLSDPAGPPGRAVPAPSRGGFRPDVEGLRAVALALVLVFHAGVPHAEGGYVGVDVFFVISGYLITGLLVREVARTQTISLAAFYARRARRIVPSAVFVLVLTLAVCFVIVPEPGRDALGRDALYAVAQVANWRFLSYDPASLAPAIAESPLLHYWSLAVEEQFYLLWPAAVLAVMAIARARGRDYRRVLFAVTLVGSVVSLLLCLVVTPVWELTAYLSTPTRAWQLGVGALVALAPELAPRRGTPAAGARRGWRLAAWAGLVAVVSAPLWCGRVDYPGWAALVPTLGTAAVIAGGERSAGRDAATSERRSAARLLAWAPLRWVGRLSYVWYLWHAPVTFVGAHFGVQGWPARLALEAATGLLAWGTSELVEKPFRFGRPFASARQGLVLGALASAIGGVVAIAVAA